MVYQRLIFIATFILAALRLINSLAVQSELRGSTSLWETVCVRATVFAFIAFYVCYHFTGSISRPGVAFVIILTTWCDRSPLVLLSFIKPPLIWKTNKYCSTA